jgi:hypothetical protein
MPSQTRVNELLKKSGVVETRGGGGEATSRRKPKKTKKSKGREKQSSGKRVDPVLDATLKKLQEYGAGSFIDFGVLQRGTAAAAAVGAHPSTGFDGFGFPPIGCPTTKCVCPFTVS